MNLFPGRLIVVWCNSKKGVVIHKGEKMARMVTDFLSHGVLMYSSDYLHAGSRFPASANQVLAMEIPGRGGHAKNAVGQRDKMLRRALEGAMNRWCLVVLLVWILWSRYSDKAETVWNPLGVLTTKEECEKLIYKIQPEVEEQNKKLRGGQNMLFCFPDTFDPRREKAP